MIKEPFEGRVNCIVFFTVILLALFATCSSFEHVLESLFLGQAFEEETIVPYLHLWVVCHSLAAHQAELPQRNVVPRHLVQQVQEVV